MPRRLGCLGWLVVALIFVGFVISSIAINAVRTGCHVFSVDGDAYEAANREVLASIPVYPQSRLENTGSIGDPYLKRCFPIENSGPYSSFRTYVNYLVPSATKPADVVRFYDRYFTQHGWTSSTAPAPNPRHDATYTRGTGYVSFRLNAHGYSFTADHDTTD